MLSQGTLVRGTIGLLVWALSANGAVAQSFDVGTQVSARTPNTESRNAVTTLASVVSAPKSDVANPASLSGEHARLLMANDSASPPPFTPPLPRREVSRRKAITLGIVLGGAVGATAGYFIAHDSCEMCNDSGSEALAAGLGAVAGAALGGFVAAQNVPPGQPQSSVLPTSTRYLSVPHPVVRYHLATFR